VRKILTLAAILAAVAAPTAAMAATVDPSLLPDTTYKGVVEKVVDNKHILVKLENGMEALLTTERSNIAFDKCKPNDQIMMSLIKGLVVVYKC